MAAPVPHFHPKSVSEPPAIVKVVTRQDVLWDRPIFKAPPLDVRPATLDADVLADHLRQVGLVQK
jgi:hypothetical protein